MGKLAFRVSVHHIGRGNPYFSGLPGSHFFGSADSHGRDWEQAPMTRRKSKPGSGRTPAALRAELLELMERQDTAEALNDNVIMPFVAALEAVCSARGYSLNIYGDCSNLVITTEEDAEAIYAMVETYLDEKTEADAESRDGQ